MSEPLTILAFHYPPYLLVNDPYGRPGHDHEVIIAAFAARSLEVNVEYQPFKRGLVDVEAGLALGVTVCPKTPDRDKFALYTDPISEFNLAMAFHKDTRIKAGETLADFRGHNIGTVRGFVTVPPMQKVGIEPKYVTSVNNGIQMVAHKRLEIFYAGREVITYNAKRLGVHHLLTIVDGPGRIKYPIRICFSKKWPDAEQLVKEFNQGLQDIKKNGLYNKIHAKYK